jgi:hypothetical protein
MNIVILAYSCDVNDELRRLFVGIFLRFCIFARKGFAAAWVEAACAIFRLSGGDALYAIQEEFAQILRQYELQA